MGNDYSDPKRRKVSSFILEKPISCAPIISCIIGKSVDDGANTLPIYTNLLLLPLILFLLRESLVIL